MFLYFVEYNREKSSLNCLFLKYNDVISFLALTTIQIDILYMFLCSFFGEIDNILETWRHFEFS